jgi:hypothetical protein
MPFRSQLLQVTAEWKKANGLIKPGPRTNQVWASLYAEIEQVRFFYIEQVRFGVQGGGGGLHVSLDVACQQHLCGGSKHGVLVGPLL